MNRDFLITFACIVVLFFAFVCTVEPARAGGDVWVTRAAMPTEESNFGAAAVDEKIYVVGSDFTYMFDPATDMWVSKTAMPTSKTFFAVAVCEGKIYVIGGSSGVNPETGISVASQTNEMYDPATDMWSSKAPMPTAAMNLQASVVGGKIYLISGMADPENIKLSNATWIYDPQADSWSQGADIPNPVFSYASAAVGSKIYVEGGVFRGPPYYSDLNQIYDTQTNTWSLGAPLPFHVYRAAAGATTGALAPAKLYVIGGSDGHDGVDKTQIYDPQTDIWSFGALMPTPRLGLGVAVLNDSLYAIGGISWLGPQNNAGQAYAVNQQYIPLNYQGPIPPAYVPTPTAQPTQTPPTTSSATPSQSATTPSPSSTPREADSSVNPSQTAPTTEPAIAIAATLITIIIAALVIFRIFRKKPKPPH